jgi:hypothetical protein
MSDNEKKSSSKENNITKEYHIIDDIQYYNDMTLKEQKIIYKQNILSNYNNAQYKYRKIRNILWFL